MAAPISDRIKVLVASPTAHDSTLAYLEVIRTNLGLCIEAFDRRLNLLLLTVITYELLTHAGTTEVSLLGFKVTKLTLIERLLPVAIGYLYYSLATIITYRRLLEEVHDATIQFGYPELYSADLERFGHPPTPFHVENIISGRTQGWFKKIMNGLSTPLQIAVAAGPALYLIYAVGRCFWRFGVADPLVWSATVIVLIFIAQVITLIQGTLRLIGDSF